MSRLSADGRPRRARPRLARASLVAVASPPRRRLGAQQPGDPARERRQRADTPRCAP
jgi:hypothetical protein